MPACSACTGPTLAECTACNDGWFLDVTYDETDGTTIIENRGCAPCHEACETCSGPEENQCLTCSLEHAAETMWDNNPRVATFSAGPGSGISGLDTDPEILCVT